MLWTAPPRHESAINVGAVSAPIQLASREGLCYAYRLRPRAMPPRPPELAAQIVIYLFQMWKINSGVTPWLMIGNC